MVILIIFIFLSLLFLALFEIEDKATKVLVFAGFVFFLVLFAGFRGDGVDRDYENYKEIFLVGHQGGIYVEPGFVFMATLTSLLSSSHVLFFVVFALVGVALKGVAIAKLSDYVFLSLLIYFCNIYLLQEMTQIRAGVASGLLLLSLIPLQNKKNYQFLAIAVIAVLFHFTAFVLFLLWFLSPDRINKTWYFVIPFSYVLCFLGLSLLDVYKLIPIEAIQAKVNTYILLQESNEEQVNILSTLVLLRLVVIYYILYHIETIKAKNKYAILVIKTYIISIATLVIMSKVSAIALRFNEFFAVVEILALPLIIYTFQPRSRIFPRVIVIIFAAILLFFHFRSKTLFLFE